MLWAMLNRIGAGSTPGQQQLAVRRVFVHARVAVAVRHVDVPLRRHGGMSAAMKWLAAHVRCRPARNAQHQQDFSIGRALAHGMIAIIGEPDGIVRRHEDPMRARKHAFSERAQEIAFAVEHDHRMLAPIEDEEIVVPVHADPAYFLERPPRRELCPVLDRLVCVCALANYGHAALLIVASPKLVTEKKVRPVDRVSNGRVQRCRDYGGTTTGAAFLDERTLAIEVQPGPSPPYRALQATIASGRVRLASDGGAKIAR